MGNYETAPSRKSTIAMGGFLPIHASLGMWKTANGDERWN